MRAAYGAGTANAAIYLQTSVRRDALGEREEGVFGLEMLRHLDVVLGRQVTVEACGNIVEEEHELLAWSEVPDAFAEDLGRADRNAAAISSVLRVERTPDRGREREGDVSRHRRAEVGDDQLKERRVPLIEIDDDERAHLGAPLQEGHKAADEEE